MKVGLLRCDEVRPEWKPRHGPYLGMFQALFPDWDIQEFAVNEGIFPTSPAEYDVWLTTGSAASVYDDLPWIHALKDFVRAIYASRARYVGVCFGHQMLAEALGGRVAKADVGWSVGIHEFAIGQVQPWMQPPRERVKLLMMCQDQVMVLPPEATVLAGTPQCPVGIFQVGDRMLGIQAHPEFTTELETDLLLLRRERIGEQRVQQALDSLRIPAEGALIGAWVRQFVSP